MSADPALLPVVGVVFLATLVRSTFGFGEALVAVPLLALLIPVPIAVPLATLLSITVAGLILAQDWREVHARSAWWLTVPTLFGIPFGLYLLTAVPPPAVKVAMAAVIAAFSGYCLFGRRKPRLTDDRLAWVFGFGAGVLGGAYGMNGPPLVVYATLRGWTPDRFRATLQGYFLPASTAGMLGFWVAGLWTSDVTRYFLWSLVPAVIAVAIGRTVNRRLHPTAFVRYVHLGLIGIGGLLLVQSVSEFRASFFGRGAAREATGRGGRMNWPVGTRSLGFHDPDQHPIELIGKGSDRFDEPCGVTRVPPAPRGATASARSGP